MNSERHDTDSFAAHGRQRPLDPKAEKRLQNRVAQRSSAYEGTSGRGAGQALNYLLDAYPDYTASVMAGNDLMRSAFGAAFPLFATAMYRNLGVRWASSVLAFISIAFIPIPFVLYTYGETLHKNLSRHARKDI